MIPLQTLMAIAKLSQQTDPSDVKHAHFPVMKKPAEGGNEDVSETL
jgi:hypothetical protein